VGTPQQSSGPAPCAPALSMIRSVIGAGVCVERPKQNDDCFRRSFGQASWKDTTVAARAGILANRSRSGLGRLLHPASESSPSCPTQLKDGTAFEIPTAAPNSPWALTPGTNEARRWLRWLPSYTRHLRKLDSSVKYYHPFEPGSLSIQTHTAKLI
jgi:hypothetical protein